MPNGTNVVDKFCILSLTYRSNVFIMMLAPLRDYLSPKHPKSSPLLCMTKDCYLARMPVSLDPNNPDFVESRWIASEDVKVERLLDGSSYDVWRACAGFMRHLFWHKIRLTVPKPNNRRTPRRPSLRARSNSPNYSTPPETTRNTSSFLTP